MPLPKPFSLVVILSSAIFACTNPPAPKTDTTKTDLLKPLYTSQTSNSSLLRRGDTTDESPEPSLQTIMADYLKECRDTVKIDTAITYNGKKLHIAFRHYCTNDSLIRIPKKYTEIYGLEEFITSNFKSLLNVAIDDTTSFDVSIESDKFHSSEHPYLNNYAVLFFNGLKIENGRIKLSYSYSIPLTDVGTAVSTEYPLDNFYER